MQLASKRIVVTGGAGFLGKHLIADLENRGCTDVFVPRKRDYDLTEQSAVERLYEDARPDLVFHLAAQVGGIGANQHNPGRFFYDNLQMGVHLIEVGRRVGVEKLVIAGTICAYPKHTPIPFREDQLWNGYPEETNAPYGIAKKALLVMSEAYRQQYGLNSIVLFPVNLYGPHDNFDLESSHVIPAMIRKCVDAQRDGKQTVTFWGDGSPTREFLYVEDCAQAFSLAAEQYDSSHAINVGAGFEISMQDLAIKIAAATNFTGEIIWDTTKPNGQPRRMLNTERAKQHFGFSAQTEFNDGLQKTISWYSSQHR
jgi:GDP-L-fucose synthase